MSDVQQLFNNAEIGAGARFSSEISQKPSAELARQVRADETIVEKGTVFTIDAPQVGLDQTPLNPTDTDKETAARLVTAAVSGIPDNLPSANPLLLYKRKKAE